MHKKSEKFLVRNSTTKNNASQNQSRLERMLWGGTNKAISLCVCNFTFLLQ